MELVLDVWEGNQFIKYGATPASATIVRINDMNGGHHMDEDFIPQWDEAQKFGAQAIYFVYNPWVSGQVNFNWLSLHAPASIQRRILIDHELTYAGSPPAQMTPQFYQFLDLIKNWGHDYSIYSGKWFVDNGVMTKWPTDPDYWWMYYPFSLQNANFSKWEEVIQSLSKATWPDKSLCPGPIRLWQACSKQAAGGLPGCNGHNIDINKWNGTIAELRAWFGNPVLQTVGLSRDQKIDRIISDYELNKPQIFRS